MFFPSPFYEGVFLNIPENSSQGYEGQRILRVTGGAGGGGGDYFGFMLLLPLVFSKLRFLGLFSLPLPCDLLLGLHQELHIREYRRKVRPLAVCRPGPC